MTSTTRSTMPALPVARASRRFSASAERVFDAWLDPEKVARWWTLAAGRRARETTERSEIDAKVGGRFSFLVRRAGQLIDHTGKYLEIDRPRRLVFTWMALDLPQHQDVESAEREGSSESSRVTIEITPLALGCEVHLAHELHPDWSDFVDRAANAWSLMLDAIEELIGEPDPAANA